MLLPSPTDRLTCVDDDDDDDDDDDNDDNDDQPHLRLCAVNCWPQGKMCWIRWQGMIRTRNTLTPL
jgi:hypothetical protein